MQRQTAITVEKTPDLEALVVASATRERPSLSDEEGTEISPARGTPSARATDAVAIGQAAATPTNLAGYLEADPGMPAEDYENGLDPVSAQQAIRSNTAGDRFLVVFVILVLLATIGIFVVLFSHVATTT